MSSAPATTATTTINVVELTSDEARQCRRLVTSNLHRCHPQSPPEQLERFLRSAPLLAPGLPRILFDALTTLRYRSGPPALLVRGLPARAGKRLGPTPLLWQQRRPDATLPEDVWLLILASQLGDPIGWASTQDGRLLTDVLPRIGPEFSEPEDPDVPFDHHVEDDFDEERTDFTGLLCLRNPDRIPTTLAALDAADLSGLDTEVLCQDRYFLAGTRQHARNLPRYPTPAPALGGDPAHPHLHANPHCLRPLPDDSQAATALQDLRVRLDVVLGDLPLRRGDVLLIDNHRAVHGTRPYLPRHNHTDRWLRKTTITAALHRYQHRHVPGHPRVIQGSGSCDRVGDRVRAAGGAGREGA